LFHDLTTLFLGVTKTRGNQAIQTFFHQLEKGLVQLVTDASARGKMIQFAIVSTNDNDRVLSSNRASNKCDSEALVIIFITK